MRSTDIRNDTDEVLWLLLNCPDGQVILMELDPGTVTTSWCQGQVFDNEADATEAALAAGWQPPEPDPDDDTDDDWK